LFTKNGCLLIATIDPGTPGARIDKWRKNLRGAWLILIDHTKVTTITDAQAAFARFSHTNRPDCTLFLSHPDISPNMSNCGLPKLATVDFSQFTHNQLNHHLNLLNTGPIIQCAWLYNIIKSSNIHNYTTRIMRLTRGWLLQQNNWSDWQHSKYQQINQYDNQGCFGEPTSIEKDDAVFFLVWMYTIKALNHRKKARYICDGSSRSGSVKLHDEVYANCIDQTSSRLFYAVATAKYLLVYGSDVWNSFAEAPPPKQGFYIRPDWAFHKWWTSHKGRPPIPEGHVIPVLFAMQGHPESPHLWEKHANAYFGTSA
jgi:hypothetical protein